MTADGGVLGIAVEAWRRVAHRGPWLILTGSALLTAPAPSRADTPMAYTYGFGAKAYPVVNLLWGLIIISLLVTAIIAVLVLVGAVLRRAKPPSDDPHRVPLIPAGSGLGFIYIGTALSTLVLFGFAAWTFATLAAVTRPKDNQTALSIHIVGHRWWWGVVYDDSKHPSRVFQTANEVHILTGTAVHVELTSSDVIHSFWVPQLTGKMDLIPGQHNETWFEADRPGTYRGECAVFCGLGHAHMNLLVIAEPPGQFNTWWTQQLEPAPVPRSPPIAQGETQFIIHCGVCHTVRGTEAMGVLGPDLSHLMSRRMIAAGTLPNTIGYLSGWIADPQDIKPGALMPILDLSGPQLSAIRDFLGTLK